MRAFWWVQDVAQFMAQQAGQLVVTPEQRNHFSCDIDPFGPNAERLRFGSVNQDDVNGHQIARKLSQNPTRDSVEMRGEFLIVTCAVFVLHPFRFDITKCPFLLIAENIKGCWQDRRKGNRARLLPPHCAPYKNGERT